MRVFGKKWIALLLSVLLLLSLFSVAAFAADDADDLTATQTDVVDPADTEPQIESEPIVARMYICARVIFIGHSWIYIENKSDAPIQVGVYTVPVGQGVSVGTHKTRRVDGAGVYYNIEAYMLRNGASGIHARGMDLTAAQLQTVNENIVNNNTWTWNNNCNRFSTRVWNSVAPNKVSYSLLPIVLRGRIGSGSVQMYRPARDQVLRQSGSGFHATTFVASNGSLVITIGP